MRSAAETHIGSGAEGKGEGENEHACVRAQETSGRIHEKLSHKSPQEGQGRNLAFGLKKIFVCP